MSYWAAFRFKFSRKEVIHVLELVDALLGLIHVEGIRVDEMLDVAFALRQAHDTPLMHCNLIRRRPHNSCDEKFRVGSLEYNSG